MGWVKGDGNVTWCLHCFEAIVDLSFVDTTTGLNMHGFQSFDLPGSSRYGCKRVRAKNCFFIFYVVPNVLTLCDSPLLYFVFPCGKDGHIKSKVSGLYTKPSVVKDLYSARKMNYICAEHIKTFCDRNL